MGKLKDLTDQEFGRLMVIERAENNNQGKTMWLCRCECGETFSVRPDALRNGRTVSCGCYRKEINTEHGLSKDRLYLIWKSMVARCNNPNDQAYSHYGGRGITVCNEWNDYKCFIDWAKGNGYTKKLTIERENVNKGYDPSNCKWATMKEQQNNRTNNCYITYEGIRRTAKQWSEELGVKYRSLLWRIRTGWPVEQALEFERRIRV